MNKGDYLEAVADYNEALRLQPDYALAYYNRGYVNAILTRQKESFTDLNTALELAQAEGDSALAARVEQLLQQPGGGRRRAGVRGLGNRGREGGAR